MFYDFSTFSLDKLDKDLGIFLETLESKLGKPVDDVYGTTDGYKFYVPVAGFKKEELSIEVDRKVITITGTSEKFKNKINTYFTAPKLLDAGKVKATIVDGMLEIEVAYIADTEKIKVEIK